MVEGALGAFWFWLAVVFAYLDEECVELVVEVGVWGGEIRFEEVLEAVVIEVGFDEVVTYGDASGVSVNDEDGSVEGVEEDGVGCLGTYAVNFEKLGF